MVGRVANVGKNCKAVCVTIGLGDAAGVAVSACAVFCAATVNATAVAIVGSCIFCPLHAQSISRTIMFRIFIFPDISILFPFILQEIIILLNTGARNNPGACI
jgi:hypothetical protein